MDQPPSIEQGLEADIAALASEIKNRRESVTVQNYSERELVREAIRAFPHLERPLPSPTAAAPTPTAPAAPAPDAPSSRGVLPEYAEHAAPEVKLEIEYLLDVALTKGIGKALAESHRSPYFVQDAFHDALAGKLYPELQKRGIVK